MPLAEMASTDCWLFRASSWVTPVTGGPSAGRVCASEASGPSGTPSCGWWRWLQLPLERVAYPVVQVGYVGYDTMFYWSHRALHHRSIYK